MSFVGTCFISLLLAYSSGPVTIMINASTIETIEPGHYSGKYTSIRFVSDGEDSDIVVSQSYEEVISEIKKCK